MTTPEPTDDSEEGTPDPASTLGEMPPVAPAYSTPPPEGLPDAEHD